MDDARESVVRANAAFYRAIEELSLEAMDAVWLHEPWIRCVHPGWDALVGWEAVRESWERVFVHTSWIRIAPTSVDVQVLGEVAVVSCSEDITAPKDEDVGVAVAQATNIFLRRPEGWRLVNHHASPAPVRVTQPFSGIVQ